MVKVERDGEEGASVVHGVWELWVMVEKGECDVW